MATRTTKAKATPPADARSPARSAGRRSRALLHSVRINGWSAGAENDRFSVPPIDIISLTHRYDGQVPQSSIFNENFRDLGRQAMLGYSLPEKLPFSWPHLRRPLKVALH